MYIEVGEKKLKPRDILLIAHFNRPVKIHPKSLQELTSDKMPNLEEAKQPSISLPPFVLENATYARAFMTILLFRFTQLAKNGRAASA